MIKERTQNYLRMMTCLPSVQENQKLALVGSSRVLRRVFSVPLFFPFSSSFPLFNLLSVFFLLCFSVPFSLSHDFLNQQVSNL